MATHSSVLAWRIPGMTEPGGLPSTGSHRVRHNWSDLAAAAAYNQRKGEHRKTLCPGTPQGPSQYQYSITKYIYTQSHVTDMKPWIHTPQSCDLREQAFPQGVVFLVDSGLCGAHVAHPQFLGKKKKRQKLETPPKLQTKGLARLTSPGCLFLPSSPGTGALAQVPPQELPTKRSRAG